MESYALINAYDSPITTTITLPASIKSIGEGQFGEWLRDETPTATIYYKGTPEQWQNVSIGEQYGWVLNVIYI